MLFQKPIQPCDDIHKKHVRTTMELLPEDTATQVKLHGNPLLAVVWHDHIVAITGDTIFLQIKGSLAEQHHRMVFGDIIYMYPSIETLILTSQNRI